MKVNLPKKRERRAKTNLTNQEGSSGEGGPKMERHRAKMNLPKERERPAKTNLNQQELTPGEGGPKMERHRAKVNFTIGKRTSGEDDP